MIKFLKVNLNRVIVMSVLFIVMLSVMLAAVSYTYYYDHKVGGGVLSLNGISNATKQVNLTEPSNFGGVTLFGNTKAIGTYTNPTEEIQIVTINSLNLKLTRKNIIDNIQNAVSTNGSFDSNTSVGTWTSQALADSSIITDSVVLGKGNTYTFSFTAKCTTANNISIQYRLFNANEYDGLDYVSLTTPISETLTTQNIAQDFEFTYTATKNECVKLQIIFNGDVNGVQSFEIASIQGEVGSVKTAFEKAHITTINSNITDMGDNPVSINGLPDGTKDIYYNDNDNFYLRKLTHNEVFDGISEVWSDYTKVVPGSKCFTIDIEEFTSSGSDQIICNRFQPVNSVDDLIMNSVCISGNSVIICIDETIAGDVTTFQSWVELNNIQLYGKASTVTDIEVSDLSAFRYSPVFTSNYYYIYQVSYDIISDYYLIGNVATVNFIRAIV